MRTFKSILPALLIASASVVVAQTLRIDFAPDAVGEPPQGFAYGYTANVGRPGRWIVRAEDGNRVLAQEDTDTTRARFALAVRPDITATDLDLSVRVRPISGTIDQAGGLVWRY